MICWLKSLFASSRSVRPTQIRRTPRMTKPGKPSRLNNSIGGTPIRKIGSSGSTSHESDWERIGQLAVAANDGLYGPKYATNIATNRGESRCGSQLKSQG